MSWLKAKVEAAPLCDMTVDCDEWRDPTAEELAYCLEAEPALISALPDDRQRYWRKMHRSAGLRSFAPRYYEKNPREIEYEFLRQMVETLKTIVEIARDAAATRKES